ncbi:MAG TPA: acetate--CoA ligase family protein [archaeon]|nr:acetate--CoA ligase family protein [archaeon]
MHDCETIIEKVLNERRSSLLINESQHICNLHHIPTPTFHVTATLDEAITKANKIGFPVVLKIVSPQILHKSDVGGVLLDIKSEDELKVGYEHLLSEVRRKAPSAKIKGVLVEKMMQSSIEVIVGGVRDSQFGPCIMFGMGGIFTEVYGDVAFRVAPIDRIDALDLVREMKGSKILEGIRGKPPSDIDSIINLLINASDLMMEHDKIIQFDLNPVIVYPDGVYVVDSRIIVGQTEGGV